MRVLLVTGSFPPMRCGVGEYTLHLAEELSECKDLKVGVLTSVEAATERLPSKIDFFPIIQGGKQNLKPSLQLLRNWKPDIVHFQIPTMGYATWGRLLSYLLFVTWCKRIPVVMTWHEPVVIKKSMWINIFLLRTLIVVRPNYLDLMPSWFRYYTKYKKFKIIPNASTVPAVMLSDSERDAVRKKWLPEGTNLIVYFGFAYPNKRIEDIFEIADPERDHIVLLCDLDASIPYQKKIMDIKNSLKWKGKITVTGFLPPQQVAEILASADAAVLPFEAGSGSWNTSMHAVMDQGTFLLTTSVDGSLGYSAVENIYRSEPGNLTDMKNALEKYCGNRKQTENLLANSQWYKIAVDHVDLYSECSRKKA